MTRTTNIVAKLLKREDMTVCFYERYPNPSDWTTNANIRVKINSTEPQIEGQTSQTSKLQSNTESIVSNNQFVYQSI
jgi:hypothetical protein